MPAAIKLYDAKIHYHPFTDLHSDTNFWSETTTQGVNLFMGTVLFVVIRLFRKKGMLSKIIATSYIFILIAGIVSLFLAKA